jgi:hypothetical protein
MTHTPGPWTAQNARIVSGNFTPVAPADGDTVISLRDNARLIAAAPELLAELKSARLMLYAFRGARKNMGLPDNHTELNSSIASIEAAIAKAEGN